MQHVADLIEPVIKVWTESVEVKMEKRKEK